MSSKKDHKFKESLEKCYSLVQQSSTKGGISAAEVGKKLGKHRTTVHGYLNTLEYMGRVESQHGTWIAKTGEPTIKPLEKEIVIELPMPKNKWHDVARLEVYANYVEELGMPDVAKIPRTILEKFNETRTIRIKGKNVDDIDLQKLGSLIQHANEKSSMFTFRGFFKGLKMPRTDSNKPSREKTQT